MSEIKEKSKKKKKLFSFKDKSSDAPPVPETTNSRFSALLGPPPKKAGNDKKNKKKLSIKDDSDVERAQSPDNQQNDDGAEKQPEANGVAEETPAAVVEPAHSQEKVKELFALFHPLKFDELKSLVESEGTGILAQRNEAFDTPLHVAAAKGEVELTQWLIQEHHCDVSAIDKKHNTPLHVACKAQQAGTISKLIELGADTAATNKEKILPIHYLARGVDMPREDFDPIFNTLLEKLPDINTTNGHRDTLLHIAALYGNTSCVKRLLENDPKIDIDKVNKLGDQALHYAVRGGEDDCVKLLLEHGADITAKGSVGDVIETAKAEEQDHLLEILTPAFAEATKDREDPKRLHIVKEVLSTEQAYLKGLSQLTDEYMPKFKARKIISAKEQEEIFLNIETLVAFHRMFCGDMEKRIATWDRNSKMGDLFIKMNNYFKLYMHYINNYDKSMSTLGKILKSKKTREFHDSIKRTLPNGLDMASLLIMPIQRIPRYVLLLQDLSKKTRPGHPDEADLADAIEKMKAIATHLNTSKRGADSRARMVELDRLLQGWQGEPLVQPARSLVFETQQLSMHRIDVDNATPETNQWVFVFTDIVVLANEKHRVLGQYTLSASHVKLPSIESDSSVVLAASGQATYGLTGGQIELLATHLAEALASPISATGRSLPSDSSAPADVGAGVLARDDLFVALTLKEKQKHRVRRRSRHSKTKRKSSKDKSKSDSKDGDDDNNDDDDDDDQDDVLSPRDSNKDENSGPPMFLHSFDLKRGQWSQNAVSGPLAPLNTLTGASLSKPSDGEWCLMLGDDGFRVARIDVDEHSVTWLGGNASETATGDDPASVAMAAAAGALSGETCGARSRHAAIASKDTVYVFGGQALPRNGERATLGDLWSATISEEGVVSWTQLNDGVDGAHPSARYSASLCLFDQQMYLFGGRDDSGAFLDDLWSFDITRQKWKQHKTEAGPAARHSAALVPFATYVVVHGGVSAKRNELNDAWAYDTNAGRWWPLDVNFQLRANHRLVMRPKGEDDDVDGGLAVIGGTMPAQIVPARNISNMIGLLLQRDTAMDQLLNESGGSKKKKRSTFMSALRDRGGSIAELTSSSKSRKERRAKAKSMQIDKGFGKNFEIGTPTDFNKQVSVNQDFEWNATDGGGSPHEAFELLRCVGQGAFGSVWQARHKTGGFEVAVKIIRAQQDDGGAMLASLNDEISMLKKVRHRCIVSYFGAVQPDEDTLWILTFFCALGSLGDLNFRLDELMRESVLANICDDVLQGLEYLHENNIVHRDIKPDNILMGADGAAMLTDFGLSEQVVESVTTRAGTPHHMAPEVVQRQPTTVASDIWSFGVTVIDLYDSQPPHADLDMQEALDAVVASPPPRTLRPSTPKLAAFIAAALKKVPEERASAAELLKMEFITTANKDDMVEFVKRCKALGPALRVSSGSSVGSSLGGSQARRRQSRKSTGSGAGDDELRSAMSTMKAELAMAREREALRTREVQQLRALLRKHNIPVPAPATATALRRKSRDTGKSRGLRSSPKRSRAKAQTMKELRPPAAASNGTDAPTVNKAATKPAHRSISEAGLPNAGAKKPLATVSDEPKKAPDSPAMDAHKTVARGTVAQRMAAFQAKVAQAQRLQDKEAAQDANPFVKRHSTPIRATPEADESESEEAEVAPVAPAAKVTSPNEFLAYLQTEANSDAESDGADDDGY